MRNPLFFRGKKTQFAIKNNEVLFLVIAFLIIGTSVKIWNTAPFYYADASIEKEVVARSSRSQLFGQGSFLIEKQKKEVSFSDQVLSQSQGMENPKEIALKNQLYEIVGEAPMKEMVPFISKRDGKVAAFLVGIAKKESSFGLASPSKDGQDCFNYWGYKGAGGRGVGMGYACFESAEEAIKVVGDRIEVLVNKNRNTPSLMVDTWKCGTSCKGDPGAPGWVSTVALYFNQIDG